MMPLCPTSVIQSQLGFDDPLCITYRVLYKLPILIIQWRYSCVALLLCSLVVSLAAIEMVKRLTNLSSQYVQNPTTESFNL